ncbi:hypothetical protein C725_0317 [Pacificimonas flava]|uniref:Transposase n=1 Tax=Pacificimonas flava TaxID=1234595 RepID=M2U8W3_9SPHN|nr:hypothetical protein C725_0317 [Pacificimonas flava]
MADFINTHPKRMEGTFCPAQAADLFLGLVFRGVSAENG